MDVFTIIGATGLIVCGAWELYKKKIDKERSKNIARHWDDYFAHNGLYPYQCKEVNKNERS